jgi:hypothetical protein
VTAFLTVFLIAFSPLGLGAGTIGRLFRRFVLPLMFLSRAWNGTLFVVSRDHSMSHKHESQQQ